MSDARTTRGKILANTYWYGLEQLAEFVIFFGTSIFVARALGPEKLGYFSYINLFVGVITSTGGTGLASSTSKYMAEFIAQDRMGVAHAVYRFTWRFQLIASLILSGVGIPLVWYFADPRFRLMSVILVASLLPGVMSWVPAQANNAFEDLSHNTISAFGFMGSYALIIVLTLVFHWDLVGVASASLVGRTVEVLMRTIPLERRMARLPLEPIPREIVVRIRRYCMQSISLQLITGVVWNRSELIFLRRYSTLTQMGFYSISAGLASKLLIAPRTLAGATSVSLMVESNRDASRVEQIVGNASRFILLLAIPIHLGAVAITYRAILSLYGPKYAGAIPVMIVASLLALPLALQNIPEVLLQSADRQKKTIQALIVTGVVNLLLDWLLVPRYAAVGAALGNGLAQSFGICLIWMQAQRYFRFQLPRAAALRMMGAGLVMAAVAYVVSRNVPGIPGLLAGIVIAVPVFLVMLKLVRALDPSDAERLNVLANRVPGRLRGFANGAVAFIVPAQ
jgi:O-antigen/teichoic acid export membrane protein